MVGGFRRHLDNRCRYLASTALRASASVAEANDVDLLAMLTSAEGRRALNVQWPPSCPDGGLLDGQRALATRLQSAYDMPTDSVYKVSVFLRLLTSVTVRAPGPTPSPPLC